MLATFGYFCPLLSTFGLFCLLFATFGYFWLFLVTFGYFWVPLDTFGYFYITFVGKYQNCNLVLNSSFWFFLVLLLILFSSVFCSLVLFQFSDYSFKFCQDYKDLKIRVFWYPSLFCNCQYFSTWGRRRPLSVLQVPAKDEGGPGGFPNLLKKEKQEVDKEEKKEDDDYE